MTTQTVSSVTNPSGEQVAASAYYIWEKEGRPCGHDMEHWLQAEAQLTVGSAQDACQNTPAKNVASAVAQALPQAKKVFKQGGRWAKAPSVPASAPRR